MNNQDYYYVVKVKHVAEEGHRDLHTEYTYRIASRPAHLPSPQKDLGFCGFSSEHDGPGNLRSYVCSDIMCIDRGSRKDKKLKQNLALEPWERSAGGV